MEGSDRGVLTPSASSTSRTVNMSRPGSASNKSKKSNEAARNIKSRGSNGFGASPNKTLGSSPSPALVPLRRSPKGFRSKSGVSGISPQIHVKSRNSSLESQIDVKSRKKPRVSIPTLSMDKKKDDYATSTGSRLSLVQKMREKRKMSAMSGKGNRISPRNDDGVEDESKSPTPIPSTQQTQQSESSVWCVDMTPSAFEDTAPSRMQFMREEFYGSSSPRRLNDTPPPDSPSEGLPSQARRLATPPRCIPLTETQLKKLGTPEPDSESSSISRRPQTPMDHTNNVSPGGAPSQGLLPPSQKRVIDMSGDSDDENEKEDEKKKKKKKKQGPKPKKQDGVAAAAASRRSSSSSSSNAANAKQKGRAASRSNASSATSSQNATTESKEKTKTMEKLKIMRTGFTKKNGGADDNFPKELERRAVCLGATFVTYKDRGINLCIVGTLGADIDTFPLLMAVARRIPLVSVKYMHESLKAGKWLDFKNYIINNNYRNTFGCAIPKGKDNLVLENCKVFILGTKEEKNRVKPLVEACGGEVLARIPASRPSNLLFLGEKHNMDEAREKKIDMKNLYAMSSLHEAVFVNNSDRICSVAPSPQRAEEASAAVAGEKTKKKGRGAPGRKNLAKG